jgi:hypothetical protein
VLTVPNRVDRDNAADYRTAEDLEFVGRYAKQAADRDGARSGRSPDRVDRPTRQAPPLGLPRERQIGAPLR